MARYGMINLGDREDIFYHRSSSQLLISHRGLRSQNCPLLGSRETESGVHSCPPRGATLEVALAGHAQGHLIHHVASAAAPASPGPRAAIHKHVALSGKKTFAGGWHDGSWWPQTDGATVLARAGEHGSARLSDALLPRGDKR